MQHATSTYNPASTTVRVIDIENLAGGSDRVEHLNDFILEILRSAEPSSERVLDIVAVGTSVLRRRPDLLWTWKGMRMLVGRGLDGADRCLAEVLTQEPASAKANRVEIWSGDGYFADVARDAQRRGTCVAVYSRPSSLSKSLAGSANETHLLPSLDAYMSAAGSLMAA